MTGLSKQQTRAFYDWLGPRLDTQAFYEDHAMADLAAHAQFERARSVFEFGCGTGRFAAHLLRSRLRPDCRYHAVDISPRMVELARQHLAPWHGRARAEVIAGAMDLPISDGSVDRFVATYVLDLLDPSDIGKLLAEAHRILMPDGLVCLVSLTYGATGIARVVTRLWLAAYALTPRLVGGCRPIRLSALLSPVDWVPRYGNIVTTWGISSEIAVSARRDIDVPGPQAQASTRD